MGAMALAAREKDFARLLRSEDIGKLRPYSAMHHVKLIHLAENQGAFRREDCEALWELGAEELLRLGRRSAPRGGAALWSVGTMLCTLFAGCVLHGSAFAPEWRSLCRAARRAGLLESRYFRLQLAIMGSWVDECGTHVDWLIDERNWSFEMADILAFVRRDVDTGVLAEDAERIVGKAPATRSLDELAGPANIGQLATYVRTVMRQSQHFFNEGLVLMVLTWAEALARHLDAHGAAGDLDEDMMRLAAGLAKIERVQQIEKSRFFRVWEPLSSGPVKERMVRLWSRSYAQPPG